MADNNDYKDALVLGLRRAGLHWLRAGYEVVAGVGALLNEIAVARKDDDTDTDDESGTEGPIRIELD